MWADLARRANRLVPDVSVAAVADALDYLCLAQLYLRDNPLLVRPLTPADVKTQPAGHWGVCPPVNRMLAALGPLQAAVPDGYELHVLHGAGHAGPSALAHAYLTGRLGHPEPDGLPAPRGCVAASAQVAAHAAGRPFAQVVPEVLRARAEQGPFRVFSPDELASNRLDLTDEHGRPVRWAVEVLSEELCHAWAQGYTETVRHALVATYEAFAPLSLSLIQQQLKHRSVRRHAGLAPLPSLVYLLTSLGWHNTFTHQNPGLTTALLAGGDPTLHVLTPADPARTAAALTFALRKLDRCTIVIADKHTNVHHPLETLDEELRHGIAIWPHLAHPGPGEPDLILASAGDLPAGALTTLARLLRTERPGLRLRYVHVHDLTVLAEDGNRPLALAPEAFVRHFGTRAPIILATSGHPADVHALLGRRHPAPDLPSSATATPGAPSPRSTSDSSAASTAPACGSSPLPSPTPRRR
ncbi:hypothetical protein OG337_28015 [[Kitasatospora] papulosa]|uniref:phosphoketolase family protein n=1 Tax=[Kitasatospora] papulosa TaxID=1464011 RepID=UPI0036A321E7|nr:hypothetical protein OG337_28015 [[Kitasatospora] papulosa]